jgi:hypothetical protein
VITCPSCGSIEVRASRVFRANDIFFRFLGRKAYRCRGCRFRFFASGAAASSQTMTGASGTKARALRPFGSRITRRTKARMIMIAVFALAFVIFWFFLRYVTSEKSQSQGTLISISSTLFTA